MIFSFKQIPGLRAPVTIIRDKSGIPHIYAANTHDLFMAQGYVQAQDRLWQMESFRAGVAGTTSQLQPSLANLKADKFVRTLGWRRAAEADFEVASTESKAFLQAFADGVNAYRDTQANNLPSEFFIVGTFGSKGPGFQPQPWDVIDSLQTAKYMAWELSGNADNEMFHVRLLQKFGEADYPAVVNALQPPYDYKNMPIIVITTEGAGEDRKMGMALGANAYVSKPVKTGELLTTVNQLLNPAISWSSCDVSGGPRTPRA